MITNIANVLNDVPRWVIGGVPTHYNWSQCRYCGRAGHDCKPATCLLCGTVQCFGNGLDNGRCNLCFAGYLPGWSRTSTQNTCARRGCRSGKPAVGLAARKPVCIDCAGVAKVRHAGASMTLAEFAAQQVTRRDAGTWHPTLRVRFVSFV